jgi:hypothetical protein
VSLSTPSGGSPWAGGGSWYVVLRIGYADFHITKDAKSFAGDSVTIAFSDFKEPEIEAVGYLTGSVTLTNVPASPPPVKIYAEYAYRQLWGYVDILNVGYAVAAGGSFSIPFTQEFLDALQAEELTVYFWLYVGSGENKYQIHLGAKSVAANGLPGDTLNVGGLGEVSLESITLSGTLKASDGGQPVPWVRISATAYNETNNYRSLGWLGLSSPDVNGQAWSLTIPVLDGERVQFYVYGYDSASEVNQLFYKDFYPEKTASVSNQSISGIELDIGDISVGRVSGTVTFADMPNPAPYGIYIEAFYGGANGVGNRATVTVNGNSGTWTIPRNDNFLAALDSGAQTVRFHVWVQFNQSENSISFATIEKEISRDGLTGIDLGSVSLAALTLSGTLNVTFNGQPVPRVEIWVSGEQGGYVIGLGGGSFNSSSYNATWTIHIQALNSPTNLSFSVSGYTATSYDRLFYVSEVATVSGASSGAISNIAINYNYEFPPLPAMPLTLDTWTDGSIESGEVAWYQFTSDGNVYYVSWNDSYDGDNTKTVDLRVSAYTSAGVSLFVEDSGWTAPRSISGQSGTIYVKVEGWSGNSAGTYAIKLSKSSGGN